MPQQVTLRDGTPVPRLGQGTWFMGESRGAWDMELHALAQGAECGMTLIDTAEMYGNGAAERLVGALVSRVGRERLFLVSKVYPHNAGEERIFAACDASRKRMGVETIDLYLLHWRGSVPLSETIQCMETLVRQGKIRRWGVSNFDRTDLEELWSTPGGSQCAANEVLYHLGSRGIEYSLLPWMQERGLPVLAYCPLAQGGALRRGLFGHEAVRAIAKAHGATPAQVLLAFLLRQDGMIAIPKAGKPRHVLENAASDGLRLADEELHRLDRAFPAPDRETPLDII